MILGIGIDLIEVVRIRDSLARFGDRLARRILRPDEFDYCMSHSDPAPYVAARFAAKEAVSKAFGTGIGSALGWQDIEVRRLESGRPEVVLHDAAFEFAGAKGCRVIHLSLTHTLNYASAMAVIEA